MESLLENVDAAKGMVRLLLLKPTPDAAAATLGKRGGTETAKRGAEFYSEISALRKTRAGGRPKKRQDVLNNGATQDSVRSRSAFVIAKRVKQLGWGSTIFAKAVHSSEQYARNLLQGVTIPSEEKIGAIIRGLRLDSVAADQNVYGGGSHTKRWSRYKDLN